MKTSEFKKRVEQMRYVVEEINRLLEIKVQSGSETVCIGWISTYEKDEMGINTINLKLAKICVEYAETPIEEREEEKKYIVILPDPRNDGEYRYALCKRHDGIGIGHVHRSGYSKLTEAEIKRNHEYLWQFAKEVHE